MSARVEGNIAIIAGLVVLFSARLNLIFAGAVALLTLLLFSVYLFYQERRS